MKILFLGSSHFSKIVLEGMLNCSLNVCAVITSPDKEVGRGHKIQANEVKVLAEKNALPVFCTEKIKNDMAQIKKIDYDMAVVASFGQILPKEFLEHRLCLNVHPSALPKYRGASPMQNTLLNGDKTTAVTIMKVGEKVDSGDIALQEEVTLRGDEYYSQLEESLGATGAKLIAKATRMLEEKSLKFYPQNDEEATYVKKFEKKDGLLDFSQSKEALYNKTRALSEPLGVYFFYKNQKIKVFKLEPCDKEVQAFKIADDKKHFLIGCQNGSVEILSLLSPSGKRQSGTDFLNGFRPQGEFVDEVH